MNDQLNYAIGKLEEVRGLMLGMKINPDDMAWVFRHLQKMLEHDKQGDLENFLLEFENIKRLQKYDVKVATK